MFSVEKRSQIMSRIRSKNTVAERIVFKFLRDNKIYFQRHYNRVSGKPDIALPRKKIAVFIDGDFWHGRNYDITITRLPKNYWRNKIETNVMRDLTNRKELEANGWKVLAVWEKDIIRKLTREAELEKIAKFLKT